MTNNHDLRIATANLKEARALRRLATFDLRAYRASQCWLREQPAQQSAALPGTPRSAREGELYDAPVAGRNAGASRLAIRRLCCAVARTFAAAERSLAVETHASASRRQTCSHGSLHWKHRIASRDLHRLGQERRGHMNFGRASPGLRLIWACSRRIKAADAHAEASLAFYERTVLTALEETEGALWTSHKSNRGNNSWKPLLKPVRKAADLAHQRS